MIKAKVPGSFRDPSGFLFFENGHIYRQINKSYTKDFDYLISSGLYDTLAGQAFLLPYTDVSKDFPPDDIRYKVLKPEIIPFISYPHEWCFQQLKDAALTTLSIQKIALEYGMCLKDASAYNIQFKDGRPVFIDTLSFEQYQEGRPWMAYRQFCEHFLGPLALMSYKDHRLHQLLRIFIDGIPLDLVSLILPRRTYFRFSLVSHIHLHAKAQRVLAPERLDVDKWKMRRGSMQGLIESLEGAVRRLRFKLPNTTWSNYYQQTNYTPEGFAHKSSAISRFLDQTNPGTVWDLGANTGVFSRLASDRGILTMAFDMDHVAVSLNYAESQARKETCLLPLVLDLTNPTGSFGWAHEERMSLMERGSTDLVLALALIHHLRISNNVPLENIAQFFSKICRWLVIEFVPKNDSMVQKLLANKDDIYFDYEEELFEEIFIGPFQLVDKIKLAGSERTLFLFKRRA